VAAGDVVAAGSGATGWSARCAYEISGDLYVVTQDSALHVWKSTDDGATWSEMDGSNAPGVNSASNSWSSEVGNGFIQALFFGTATALNLIRFSLSTDEWEGSIVGNDSAAANPTAPVRLTVHSNSQWIRFTDGSDDTDL